MSDRSPHDDLTPKQERELSDAYSRDVLGVEPPSPEALAEAQASGLLESEEEPCSELDEDEVLDAFMRQHFPRGGGP
jgi:hypothetical protein